MNILKKLIISATLGISFLYAANYNLLDNPGFENGNTSWTFDDSHSGAASGVFTISTTEVHTGNSAAYIKMNSVSEENWHAQLNTPSEWNANEGKKYILTFYAKGSTEIHVAAQGGQPDYTYLDGSDFMLTSTWKKIEYSYVAPASGNGALRFNIFVGNAIGDYYFDDFEVIEEVEIDDSYTPENLQLQTKGSFYTGQYRNAFLEIGKTQADIDTKIESVFQQYFYGDDDDERLYYPIDDNMAYIKAIDSDDIRSEGMSYGLMISLQLNKKEEFDRLWKFSKTYMQHLDGDRKGYFSWQLHSNSPYSMMDPNPAPDGEEYFVMALFFATKRWGNGEGIFNYEAEANAILHEMIHKETNHSVRALMDPDAKQIVFSPYVTNEKYTDPSYHLPAFYRLWSIFASADNDYWNEVADTSRAFFKNACHPESGLTTDYAAFDGSPQSTDFNQYSDDFAYDSHRVGMNIAMDFNWFHEDAEWQLMQSNRWLSFFTSKGNYKSLYTYDGSTALNTDQMQSLVSMNGVAAMASNNEDAADYINAVWNLSPPSGKWRYYNGLLYVFGLLNLSGNYQIYGIQPTDTITHTTNDFAKLNTNNISFSVMGRTLKVQSISNIDNKYHIYNMQGKLMESFKLNANHSKELHFKAGGSYILVNQSESFNFVLF